MRKFTQIGALFALAFAACQTVPYTGRHELILVSSNEERSLGLTEYQKALSQSKLSNNPEQVAMVRRVGQRIAQAADRPDYQWEFNLIDDPKTVNAWCLPGGKVAVYSGILPITQDDNGLAVVLGHEISHALARHGAERMSQGLLAQFGGVALSVALANEPAATSQLYQEAYGIGVQTGVMLPHSRAQESEADHIGLLVMAKAGYDPRGAIPFWQRMKALSGQQGQGSLTRYLSDHPTDDKRIKDIEKEMPEALRYYKGP